MDATDMATMSVTTANTIRQASCFQPSGVPSEVQATTEDLLFEVMRVLQPDNRQSSSFPQGQRNDPQVLRDLDTSPLRKSYKYQPQESILSYSQG